MKPLRTFMPFVMALAVTGVTVPQASSQTAPAQQAQPNQQAPPAQEQQNTHPVARGLAAGAAFGAAANATGAGGNTVVVNRGSANRQASGSANRQAKGSANRQAPRQARSRR